MSGRPCSRLNSCRDHFILEVHDKRYCCWGCMSAFIWTAIVGGQMEYQLLDDYKLKPFELARVSFLSGARVAADGSRGVCEEPEGGHCARSYRRGRGTEAGAQGRGERCGL